MNLKQHIDESISAYAGSFRRIVVAFSGGLDSCVLLHLLATENYDFDLLVWHVNHGLLDCAEEMESFCQDRASHYGIEFKVSHLRLDSSQSNLEAVARKARYAEFEGALDENDVLLTAHHADDQVETFFLNLFRGSGSAGLRGIARSKPLGQTRLLRPLLNIPRQSLEQFSTEKSLDWFEDPSNSSDRFDRNYLRQRIMPLVKTRWQAYLDSIQRICEIQSEIQSLLDEVGEADYLSCRLGDYRVCQKQLTSFSVARQKNTIRFWLRANQLDSLPTGRLVELIKQLGASKQAHPLIHTSQYDIRIFKDQVFIVKQQQEPVLKAQYDLSGAEAIHISPIDLKINRAEILGLLKIADKEQVISLHFRQKEPSTMGSKHRLKHLFQKYRVPPWLRDQTPQIYIDGELKDLWLD